MKQTPEAHSVEKIGWLNQLRFDTRATIAVGLSVIRANHTGFDVRDYPEVTAEFLERMKAYDEHELEGSRKINKLLGDFGVTIRTEGVENIPDQNVIFAGRHESWWETAGLHALLVDVVGRENTPRFVFKKEFLDYPGFGKMLARSGHLPIDRSSKQMSALIHRIEKITTEWHRDVVIFPESTRIPNGALAPTEYYRNLALFAKGATPIIPFFIQPRHIVGKQESIFNIAKGLPHRLPKDGGEILVEFGEALTREEIRQYAFRKFIASRVRAHELLSGEKPRIYYPETKSFTPPTKQ